MSSAQARPIKRTESRKEAGERTRARIVDVAERLFAENGVDGTSLRAIMSTAGVSISLINYHFGTKENLLKEIFERRAIPMNQERLAMLAALHDNGAKPSLEELLYVFVVPPIKAGFGGTGSESFFRLLGRISADPSPVARKILGEYFDSFHHQFYAELKNIFPDLSDKDFYWRLHCLLGVVMYTAMNPERTYDLSGGLCNPRDIDSTFQSLLPLLIALIQAPRAA